MCKQFVNVLIEVVLTAELVRRWKIRFLKIFMICDNNEAIGSDSSSEFESAAKLAAGTVLNNEFELFELLGHGGMGVVVWQAKDQTIRRKVVLQFLEVIS